MNRLIGYLIAKFFELFFFTVLVSVYYNIIHPADKIAWMRELLLSFSLVLTFFIVSLYFATSLAAHVLFQEKKRFGNFCAGAYAISALFFLALNPVTGWENLLILIIALPIVYAIGRLAKRLTMQLRQRAVK
jgi:hypothetical protein